MKPKEFWQNFKMGEEQEIAANFIYDGLKNLHEMDTLSMETEVFPVLYNISIGIERLMKVAIVLLEFNDNTDVAEFEKSLITHSHMELYARLKPHNKLNLSKSHMDLLQLLTNFYHSHRYDRFTLQSGTPVTKDKNALHEFISKYLKVDIAENYPMTCVWNTPQIKRFIGKTVKKITKNLYSIIDESARAKNLYTYEISGGGSKAGKVLWGNEFLDFEDEDRIKIESLIFLMNLKGSGLVDTIKQVTPLPLDPALDTDHLQNLLRVRAFVSDSIRDEIESEYEELTDVKERLEIIDLIRNPGVSFGEMEDIDSK
jgi:hypothetical protein